MTWFCRIHSSAPLTAVRHSPTIENGLRGNVDGGSLVIVADGDDIYRALIVSLLKRVGYETLEATTGDEALAHAFDVRPSLVLVDVSCRASRGTRRATSCAVAWVTTCL